MVALMKKTKPTEKTVSTQKAIRPHHGVWQTIKSQEEWGKGHKPVPLDTLNALLFKKWHFFRIKSRAPTISRPRIKLYSPTKWGWVSHAKR